MSVALFIGLLLFGYATMPFPRTRQEATGTLLVCIPALVIGAALIAARLS